MKNTSGNNLRWLAAALGFVILASAPARGDLASALDATNLVWTTFGDAQWTTQNNYDLNGFLSPMGRSGVITNNQSSTLQTTVTGPGRLSFWWKVSSQPTVDYLAWLSDGVEQARISGPSNPGSAGWVNPLVYFSAGSHTLQWVYIKGASGSGGQDVGWLDHVTYTPGIFLPTISSQPTDVNIVPGSNATFQVQATGATPLGYQWQREGADLPGATNSSLTISNAQLSDRGNYRVVVSNPYDSTISSNAFLNVFLFVGPTQPQDAIDRWYFRSTLQFTKVRFTGGRFIGVGVGGLLAISPDGKTWTRQNSGTTNDLTGIAYGSLYTPEFVAVGKGGTVLFSGDGTNWTKQVFASGDLSDVAYNDNTGFVAGFQYAFTGQPNVMIIYGTNYWEWAPITFPLSSSPYSYRLDAIFSFGSILVVAAGYQFADDIWTSPDGFDWAEVGFADAVIGGIGAGNGRAIMVGWEGWPRVSTNDGSTWVAAPSSVITPNAYQPPLGALPMVGGDISFGNGTFLVVRSFLRNGGFLTTSDGFTWAKRNNFIGAGIESVAYGNGTYVVVSSGGTYPPGIYQSENVATPMIVSDYLSDTNNMTLSISGEIGRTYRLQTSPDLLNWTDRWSYTNLSGATQFVDTNAMTLPQLFYRVVSP